MKIPAWINVKKMLNSLSFLMFKFNLGPILIHVKSKQIPNILFYCRVSSFLTMPRIKIFTLRYCCLVGKNLLYTDLFSMNCKWPQHSLLEHWLSPINLHRNFSLAITQSIELTSLFINHLIVLNVAIFGKYNSLVLKTPVIALYILKLMSHYTGRFITYSGITKIYYRKTVGHVFTKPVQIEGTIQIFFPQVSCFSS